MWFRDNTSKIESAVKRTGVRVTTSQLRDSVTPSAGEREPPITGSEAATIRDEAARAEAALARLGVPLMAEVARLIEKYGGEGRHEADPQYGTVILAPDWTALVRAWRSYQEARVPTPTEGERKHGPFCVPTDCLCPTPSAGEPKLSLNSPEEVTFTRTSDGKVLGTALTPAERAFLRALCEERVAAANIPQTMAYYPDLEQKLGEASEAVVTAARRVVEEGK